MGDFPWLSVSHNQMVVEVSDMFVFFDGRGGASRIHGMDVNHMKNKPQLGIPNTEQKGSHGRFLRSRSAVKSVHTCKDWVGIVVCVYVCVCVSLT